MALRRQSTSGDDIRAYVTSEQFRADFEEASRLILAGDTEGLAAFASRNAGMKAKKVAAALRHQGHPGSDTGLYEGARFLERKGSDPSEGERD